MWWRILIPTWRFFNAVGPQFELLVRVQGEWRVAFGQPRLRWYTLFFNPSGNSYHAVQNLLERLVSEVSAGAEASTLVSFALVKDLAQDREFKVTANGEDAIHWQVTP